MYEAFYGLTTKPFQLSPDPAFYFNSKQHRRAKAYLEFGVARSEGFIVITGEIGAGKTTILSDLLERLSNTNVTVGQLVTTQLDAEDTLRMVGAAFGIDVTGVDKAQLLMTIEAFLLDQVCRGRRCLLVVDEAQNLSPRALEELRMLSNYQVGTRALLQSFLVGQPEFKRMLQRPEMEQLRQRVAATCHLGAMDAEDTHHYVEHRLRRAGATDVMPFSPEAIDAIHAASKGIPRRINTLCDRLLLAGYLAGEPAITHVDVEKAVAELVEEGTMDAPAGRVSAQPTHAHDAVDTDMGRLALDAASADDLSSQIGGLFDLQQNDRLQRLERSVLRLERISLETLQTMKLLVKAARRRAPSGGPK